MLICEAYRFALVLLAYFLLLAIRERYYEAVAGHIIFLSVSKAFAPFYYISMHFPVDLFWNWVYGAT